MASVGNATYFKTCLILSSTHVDLRSTLNIPQCHMKFHLSLSGASLTLLVKAVQGMLCNFLW